MDGLLDSIFDGGKPATGSENLIASLLRVEGMFNINSTSVEAWRVLLSNLNNQDIVTQNEAGELKITKIDEGVPVIGLLAPQDTLAKGQSPVPAGDPEQWAGRRVLSETEITLLAGAIVREIRKRGPFLSLADFVNRRVGSDTDRAYGETVDSSGSVIARAWCEAHVQRSTEFTTGTDPREMASNCDSSHNPPRAISANLS